jgi:hypothetical protein
MNKYQSRLYNEWLAHGKCIIAVDFDGTISPFPNIDNQRDIDYAIEVLQLCKAVGCYIVINTATNKSRFDVIRRHCKDVGLDIDAINENVMPNLPYGHDGKVYANVYVDDRSFGFVEGLKQLEWVAILVDRAKKKPKEESVKLVD